MLVPPAACAYPHRMNPGHTSAPATCSRARDDGPLALRLIWPSRPSNDKVARMPTLEHNGLIEMFRENPNLAPHFIEALFHLDVPPHATVRVADSSLDQLIPVEFRADLVLELCDEKGTVV